MRYRLLFVTASLAVTIQGPSVGRAAETIRKYGDVPAPTYGDVPAPKYGDVPAPAYGDVKPPGPRGTAETAPASEEHTGTATPPAPAAPAYGQAAGTLNARYFYMEGGVLHTWEFAPDGTYLYTEAMKGAGFSRRNSERGTYRLAGTTLEVRPAKQTEAAVAGAPDGKTSTLTAGTGSTTQTHRYRVKLLGPAGREGMILDGVRMKVKSW